MLRRFVQYWVGKVVEAPAYDLGLRICCARTPPQVGVHGETHTAQLTLPHFSHKS